jgi:5-methylcytosine-specific restriction endonuclease McrA
LRAVNSSWAKANSARKQDINAKWASRNPGVIAAQQRRWYLANAKRLREKAKINGPKWREANPEKRNAIERNRRARKRAAEGSHTASDIAAIRKMQKDKCAICRAKLFGAGDVDHIQPLLRGGSNKRSNLQLLCGPCNGSKGPKDPIEFMQSLGRLL